MARIALSMADPDVLVRASLDLCLLLLRRGDVWARPDYRVDTHGARRTLVRLSDHPRVGGSKRWPFHVRVTPASLPVSFDSFFFASSTLRLCRPVTSAGGENHV